MLGDEYEELCDKKDPGDEQTGCFGVSEICAVKIVIDTYLVGPGIVCFLIVIQNHVFF